MLFPAISGIEKIWHLNSGSGELLKLDDERSFLRVFRFDSAEPTSVTSVVKA